MCFTGFEEDGVLRLNGRAEAKECCGALQWLRGPDRAWVAWLLMAFNGWVSLLKCEFLGHMDMGGIMQHFKWLRNQFLEVSCWQLLSHVTLLVELQRMIVLHRQFFSAGAWLVKSGKSSCQ